MAAEQDEMTRPVELHAYMGLSGLFKQRQWPNPTSFELDTEISGPAFLERLGIASEGVEVMFINRVAFGVEAAVIRPGDRVALVPPGVPGPHRFLLGFKNK